jgi:hypothetical protein
MAKQTSTEVPKVTPFTTIKHISETRPLSYKDLPEMQLPYEPFLVNRAFSLSEDTVLIAALMNERSGISHDMQASFYIGAIRARRRFEKWPKGIADKDVDTIASYYAMSKKEARLHQNLHTKAQLKTMQSLLDAGAIPQRIT